MLLVMGYATTALAAAEAAPNISHEQLLQQERERWLQDQQQAGSDVRLQASGSDTAIPDYPEQESPCFMIGSIGFSNTQAESQAYAFALQSVTQGSGNVLGRCLGSMGLRIVLMRVQQALIKQGYVTTRVLAGEQNLSGGHIVLTVVPGLVGAVRFSADSATHASLWNSMPLAAGERLNLRALEQGLENFKRLPTVDAEVDIAPASLEQASPGMSDIIIRHKQAFPLRLTLSVDDGGSKSTGKYLGGLTVSGDNLLTLSDLFYINLNHDLGGDDTGKRGSRGYAWHYSVPYQYWLLGFNSAGYDYYQRVAGLKQAYVYSGQTQNSDIRLSHMLYRSAYNKTLLNLKGFLRTSSNDIDGTEIEVQRRRTAGWELGVGQSWTLGASTLEYSLAYKRGTGAMHALPAPEEASKQGTARMEILTLDLAYQRPFSLPVLGIPLRYSLNLRAQSNMTTLTAQDRFAIGNRYTVRGFDGQQILSADKGWFVRNDLSMPAFAGQTVYLGLDYGAVGGPSSEYLLGRQLAGAVVGLKGEYKKWTYDCFLGQPIKRPDGFKTPHGTAGIQLNLQL